MEIGTPAWDPSPSRTFLSVDKTLKTTLALVKVQAVAGAGKKEEKII